MEVERTPLPGPPWVHLRTSGRNALEGTISKRFNLFICAVKKGKRNEPGTMTAIDLRDQTQISQPYVLQCKHVSNPSLFAWQSNTCRQESTTTSETTEHLLVAGGKMAEIWTLQSNRAVHRFPHVVRVPLPKEAGVIGSVHWRPLSPLPNAAEFMLVTKQAAYVYVLLGDARVKGPIRTMAVPVKGSTSVCDVYNHSTVAFCGGGIER